MPKPASISGSFMISSGLIRSGLAEGRARPISTLCIVLSQRNSCSRSRRAPRPLARSRFSSSGSSRSMPAMMSSSSPIGSGRVSRTAKCSAGRAGETGSGSLPIAWSSRRTRSRPSGGPARRAACPIRSPIRRRPSAGQPGRRWPRRAAARRPAAGPGRHAPGPGRRCGPARRDLQPRAGAVPPRSQLRPLHGAGAGGIGLLVDGIARLRSAGAGCPA